MKEQCSFCDSDAVRESGPKKLITCYDCHVAYSRGHAEGYAQGQAEERARVVAWLRAHYRGSRSIVDMVATDLARGEHVPRGEGGKSNG